MDEVCSCSVVAPVERCCIDAVEVLLGTVEILELVVLTSVVLVVLPVDVV